MRPRNAILYCDIYALELAGDAGDMLYHRLQQCATHAAEISIDLN